MQNHSIDTKIRYSNPGTFCQNILLFFSYFVY